MYVNIIHMYVGMPQGVFYQNGPLNMQQIARLLFVRFGLHW